MPPALVRQDTKNGLWGWSPQSSPPNPKPQSGRQDSGSKMARQIAASTMNDAQAFAEFDANGDQKLDFDEFYSMQPNAVRDLYPVELFREWFDLADADGNGTLTVNEFFAWSIANAGMSHGGKALEALFKRWDNDGTGLLDSIEFAAACEDLGFGSVATEIFKSIDTDGSGTVAYSELISGLTRNGSHAGVETKVQLTAFACSVSTAKAQKKAAIATIDTSGWRIKGRDAGGVRSELQELLRASDLNVADLMRLFDEDGKADETGPLHLLIDQGEFHRTMRGKFGYKGPPDVLTQIFAGLDTDASGQIGFDELYEFIKGRRHSLDPRGKPALELTFELPEGIRLDDLLWDADLLRFLVADMLSRCKAGANDLLRRWYCRRGLDEATFLSRIRETFFTSVDDELDEDLADLWEYEVRECAVEAFDHLIKMVRSQHAARTIYGRVSIVHFERWLDASNEAHVRRLPPLIKYTLDTLPLKTSKQRRDQEARRRENSGEADEAIIEQLAKIDWVAKAGSSIAAAASNAVEREVKIVEARRQEYLEMEFAGRSPRALPSSPRVKARLGQVHVYGASSVHAEVEVAGQSQRALPSSPRLKSRLGQSYGAGAAVPVALTLRPASARAATVPWTMHAHAARARATPNRTARSIQWYSPSRSPEAIRVAQKRETTQQVDFLERQRAALIAARQARAQLNAVVTTSRWEMPPL